MGEAFFNKWLRRRKGGGKGGRGVKRVLAYNEGVLGRRGETG